MTLLIGTVKRHNGIAGSIAYSVPVTYPGEDTEVVTFIGSSYADCGPVVMVTGSGVSSFVVNPERFGRFGPSWVRSFFA